MSKTTYVCGYRVLVANSLPDLEELVMSDLEYGWQPLGGMQAIRKSEMSQSFTQTMIQICERL